MLFFVAAGRMRTADGKALRAGAALLVVVLLGVVGFFALFALFAQENPVCWARNPETGQSFRLNADPFVHGSAISMDSRDLPPGATEAGFSSDSISIGEGSAAIVAVAAMLGAGWALSKPPDQRLTSGVVEVRTR